MSLKTGKYASLLKKTNNNATASKPDNVTSLPAELTSKLIHEITQVTVFYQINQNKEGFRLPMKRIFPVAHLAK